VQKTAEPARPIWLQRGKAQDISSRRATILLALSRSWIDDCSLHVVPELG
jgi:hypothetical protein